MSRKYWPQIYWGRQFFTLNFGFGLYFKIIIPELNVDLETNNSPLNFQSEFYNIPQEFILYLPASRLLQIEAMVKRFTKC